jgi:hypothetical protein
MRESFLLLGALLNVVIAEPFLVDVTDFGAIGDGIQEDTIAIQQALDSAAASNHSSTTVWFPPLRDFLTGPLNVSHVDDWQIQIDGNLTCIAPQSVETVRSKWPTYPPLPSYDGTVRSDGWPQEYQAFLYFYNVTNLIVKGTGTVHGQGSWWWEQKKQNTPLHGGRPKLIRLESCRDVEISGITLQDSPHWNLQPVYCQNVHIHHLTIRASTLSKTPTALTRTRRNMSWWNTMILTLVMIMWLLKLVYAAPNVTQIRNGKRGSMPAEILPFATIPFERAMGWPWEAK